MSDENTMTEAAVVGQLAQEAASPKLIESPTSPYLVVVPAGAEAKQLDFERYCEAPRRKAGTYRPADVASLIDYAANHADALHTTLWVDPVAATVLAVLNDHAAEASAWGDHRALLTLAKTPEWKLWRDRDGSWLTQEDFAEHIQDGVKEIVEPDAADMLEIAQTLHGKTEVNWRSANRIDNGQVAFGYSENVEARAGAKGELQVPQEIALEVAPFLGESPRKLGARIRYRVREGQLRIGYKLERPHELELEALEGIANTLRRNDAFARVYLGAPRS